MKNDACHICKQRMLWHSSHQPQPTRPWEWALRSSGSRKRGFPQPSSVVHPEETQDGEELDPGLASQGARSPDSCIFLYIENLKKKKERNVLFSSINSNLFMFWLPGLCCKILYNLVHPLPLQSSPSVRYGRTSFRLRASWVLSYSLPPHGLQTTRLLSPWDFSGKNSGVGIHPFPSPGDPPHTG